MAKCYLSMQGVLARRLIFFLPTSIHVLSIIVPFVCFKHLQYFFCCVNLLAVLSYFGYTVCIYLHWIAPHHYHKYVENSAHINDINLSFSYLAQSLNNHEPIFT